MGPHYRIINGDSYNEIEKLEKGSVDVIFTSPDPEIMDDRTLQIFLKTWRVLKDEGALFVQVGDFHDEYGSMQLIPERFVYDMCRHGWIIRSKLIWVRPDDSIQEDFKRFKRDWEHVYMFTKSKDHYFNNNNGYHKTSVIWAPFIQPPPEEFASGFPESVIDVCLTCCTPPNGTVLDPFCDSAVTGVVALKKQFNFIGIEIDKDKISKINKKLRGLKL
jgi:DNA modification methylase